MYAVIFKAKTNKLDVNYQKIAKKMRYLAITEYNCIDFISATEGDVEIAISYWHKKCDIKKWKNNTEHKKAQKLGINKWYKSYKIEIVKIKHNYKSSKL